MYLYISKNGKKAFNRIDPGSVPVSFHLYFFFYTGRFMIDLLPLCYDTKAISWSFVMLLQLCVEQMKHVIGIVYTI